MVEESKRESRSARVSNIGLKRVHILSQGLPRSDSSIMGECIEHVMAMIFEGKREPPDLLLKVQALVKAGLLDLHEGSDLLRIAEGGASYKIEKRRASRENTKKSGEK